MSLQFSCLFTVCSIVTFRLTEVAVITVKGMQVHVLSVYIDISLKVLHPMSAMPYILLQVVTVYAGVACVVLRLVLLCVL